MARQDYQNLQSTSFHGVIIAGVDYKNQGRYKVHIPQLMPNIQNDGIFVYNKIHNQLNTTYGEYKPLQIGTEVLISFKNGDYKNGEIIKIVENTANAIAKREAPIPVPNVVPEDRDKITVLARTKENHLICLVDSTLPEDKGGTLPGQSIHIYHSNGREKIVLDGGGIHITCGTLDIIAAGNINMKAAAVNIDAEVNIETIKVKTLSAETVKGSTISSPNFKGPLPTGGGEGGSAPSIAAPAQPPVIPLIKKKK